VRKEIIVCNTETQGRSVVVRYMVYQGLEENGGPILDREGRRQIPTPPSSLFLPPEDEVLLSEHQIESLQTGWAALHIQVMPVGFAKPDDEILEIVRKAEEGRGNDRIDALRTKFSLRGAVIEVD
jgi:hypothetical protein